MVARPCRWDTDSVRRFMVMFGPISSVFDIATFAALFFWICPSVAGGAWGALDAAGQALFTGTFQAGWFIESMWTQTLAVHLMRSERPLLGRDHAAWVLISLGVAGLAVATALPFTPLGEALDLNAPPAQFAALLAAAVAGYAGTVAAAKRAYVHREGSLL